MIIHNSEIAEIFEQKANLLDIKDDNPFRIRAYRRAAQTIRNLTGRLEEMVDKEEDLTKLDGIGKDLAEKIKEIVETGKLKQLEDLKKEIPSGLLDILAIEGLGPKRVKKLYQQLNIESVEDLKKAIKSNQVENLDGFGKKTAENITRAIGQLKGKDKRKIISEVEEIIQPLINYLKKDKNTNRAVIAGSFRRRQETIGDVDILVSSPKGKQIIDRFIKYEEVSEILSQGETKSSVKLRTGMQIDLRAVEKGSFGAALIYFTGSKSHNIELRNLAIKQGYKVSEYGIYKNGQRAGGETEKEVYQILGLDYIPPELREARGEIQAAEKKRLPNLVKLEDIAGDLQMHTTGSDGKNTIEEMAKAAKKLGRQYIAITDHSAHLGITNGLNDKQLEEQIEKIDKINKKIKGIRILKSVEVDILENGSLDIKDSVLKQLDIVTASVHTKFNLPAKKQTDRIIIAMDNKQVNIIGHPTGRIINRRPPYRLEMERLFKAAKQRNCILEINAHPSRLDLNDVYAKRAKEIGVKMAINTDAHRVEELGYLRYGVDQARRGWLEAEDIINTLPVDELEKAIARK